MVREPQQNNKHGEPPPLDESWWQSVLSEAERQDSTTSQTYVARTKRDSQEEIKLSQTDEDKTDWETAYKLFELDESVNLQVNGYNRGGLLVNGSSLQGFVPVSHLVDFPEERNDIDAALQGYLHRTLHLKIIECDQARGRVVFSERAAQSEPGKRIVLLNNLKPGDCLVGNVTNITDFGVFVDLGGVEGLIHVSEISWGRVQHPADVVSLGEELEVYVIQVDRERSRVALSLKRLHSNPWENAHIRYQPGQITEAVVTSIVTFGAFARLEEGLDGLIHISEMDCAENVGHPSEILQEGERVQVRILQVDCSRQRLGLSLKLEDEPNTKKLA